MDLKNLDQKLKLIANSNLCVCAQMKSIFQSNQIKRLSERITVNQKAVDMSASQLECTCILNVFTGEKQQFHSDKYGQKMLLTKWHFNYVMVDAKMFRSLCNAKW